MKRQILVLAAVVTFLCPTGLQAEIVYTLIDLGTLGGDQSWAYSINDAGQIVGGAENNQGRLRATLFDRTGAGNNLDLGTLGGFWSQANSINNAGQIVGGAENRQNVRRATLFNPTAPHNNRDLSKIRPGKSWAYSINDAGQIVGVEYNRQRGSDRATLFHPTRSSGDRDLGTLGGWSRWAYSINNAGQIVGKAYESWQRPRATLFDPTWSPNNIDLGTLGGPWSQANSINNAGQIVGNAENSEHHLRATLFDPTGAGNNIDLGIIGGDQSWARSINDAGQIVGEVEISMGLTHATLFDPTGAGNNIDLNTVIDPASGWTLKSANDINASGWIVGWGYNREGERHAFLLVPCLRVCVLHNEDPDYETPPFGDTLTYLDASGRVLRQQTGINMCQAVGGHRALAVSDFDQTVLVCENTTAAPRVVKYNLAGGEVFAVTGHYSYSAADVAGDGTIYALTSTGTIYGDTLLKISPRGSILAEEAIGGVDLVVDDLHGGIYIVGADVKYCDLDLAVQWTIDPIGWCAVSVDTCSDGTAWLTERSLSSVNRLVHVSQEGAVLQTLDLDYTPYCVRVDKLNDNIFVGSARFYRYDDTGQLAFSIPLPCPSGQLWSGWSLAIDPDRRGVWVGTHHDVRLISFEGTTLLVNDQFSRDDQKYVVCIPSGKPLTPTLASNPSPAHEATDVPRDVTLSWAPGMYADKHDVYFGTGFNDVNDADRTNPLGVLASQNQDANTYDPAGVLDFGQTYYWRVDEVNASPDFTIFKGDVWQFTVEPIAYPIAAENITATASSSNTANEGPENTINGSGLDADDLHSAENRDMWLSSVIGPQPTWIQYEFNRVYKLHQMWVWNYNTPIEPAIGFGVKDATIEYSTDGANWTTLGTTHEFARAPGAADYAHNTTVDLSGVAAKYVKITANSNWGGILPQYGLSEVRFFYVPVLARELTVQRGEQILAFEVERSKE